MDPRTEKKRCTLALSRPLTEPIRILNRFQEPASRKNLKMNSKRRSVCSPAVCPNFTGSCLPFPVPMDCADAAGSKSGLKTP